VTQSSFLTIDDIVLEGKRTLVRVDFNVPLKNGHVVDDTRIRACLPTIEQLLAKGATVVLMSHLGRPEEGQPEDKYSLAPVAGCLSAILNKDVPLIANWRDGIDTGEHNLVILENVRFEKGEKANNDDLARQMASLCDVYVNDAFATTHRAQASTHGVAKYAAKACAGPLLTAELTALSNALDGPATPMIAVVGGSKVSTKLTVLETLLDKVDQLIVGGGIANTFLLAAGYPVGKSLCEPGLVDTALGLMQKARSQGKDIPLPTDVICGKEFDENTSATIKSVNEVQEDDMIMDVGPDTAVHYADLLKSARTIVWNGPLGVFEFDQFSQGTESLSRAIADSDAFSIAGGGDTLAAISKFNIAQDVSYISTGGGAFLELLEGKELPAVSILKSFIDL
jgi:phosphoglycerate kinase